jgi:Common central domain of tyrosinase
LPVVPRRRPLDLSSVTQNQQYASLHATFTSTTGAVNEHLAWHQSHGSGSDDYFLFWHRYYLRWLEDYLGAQGADYTAPVPYWPSNTPIPAELSAGTLDTTPNVTPPSWTTMAGGTTPAPFFGYPSLGQFKSSAELGRAIGASYHGTVHGTVGGTMATFSSPLAPIFYPWHGYVDHIWAEWQRRTMALPVVVVRGQVESTDAGAVRINLFVRRADGKLWERYWNGSAWTWVDTGKPADGEPLALIRGDTDSIDGADVRINLFAPVLQATVSGGPTPHTHYDIRLWERYWNGAAWSWVDTGKDIRGRPAAIVRSDVEDVGTSALRINLWSRATTAASGSATGTAPPWAWADSGAAVAI